MLIDTLAHVHVASQVHNVVSLSTFAHKAHVYPVVFVHQMQTHVHLPVAVQLVMQAQDVRLC